MKKVIRKATSISSEKSIISDKERWQMIAATAYNIADERGFDKFSPDHDPKKDWKIAERMVDEYLSYQKEYE